MIKLIQKKRVKKKHFKIIEREKFYENCSKIREKTKIFIEKIQQKELIEIEKKINEKS